MDIWIYGYLDIWIFGYLDIWMDKNDGRIFLGGRAIDFMDTPHPTPPHLDSMARHLGGIWETWAAKAAPR